MNKKILFGQEARNAILKGMKKVNNAVSVTLGPGGSNVIIDNQNSQFGDIKAPVITKDGITVIKEIFSIDEKETTGINLIKRISSETNKEAGDGTTTAAILGYNAVKNAAELLGANFNPIEMSKGMKYAAGKVIDYMESIRVECDTHKKLLDVATISTNNDKELSKIICDTVRKVGNNGIIQVEESTLPMTTSAIIEGMTIEKGYYDQRFCNDKARRRVLLHDPMFYITTKDLKTIEDVMPFLKIAKDEKKAIVFIANEISGQALSTILLNSFKGAVQCVAIKAPSLGDRRNNMLEDIAINVGAKFFSEDTGESFDLDKDDSFEQFGGCKTIIVKAESTAIIGGYGTDMEKQTRITELQAQLQNTIIDFDKEEIRKRIAAMAGRIAVINVGGYSEVEIKEKRDRVDDAIGATSSALSEGIIPGCGMALYRAAKVVNNEIDSLGLNDRSMSFRAGMQAIRDTCKAPFTAILLNAKLEIGEVTSNIYKSKSPHYGLNIVSGKYGNLIKLGVIDPFKVTRVALMNAVSIASTFISTECYIYQEKSNERVDEGIQFPGMR